MVDSARLKGLVHLFWSSKVLNPGALICCIGLVIAARVFEIYGGEDPCPLCLFQRYFVIIVGVFFALATSLRYFPHNGWRAFTASALVAALLAFLVLPEAPGGFIPQILLLMIERLPLFLRYLLFASFVISTLVYLLGATHWVGRKTLLRLAGVALLVAAAFGAGTSLRHVWIQSLPADLVPACTPPLDFMVQIQGVWGAIEQTFMTGSGDCHDSSWRFLFLTMPMWVLFWFVGLGVFGFVRNGILPQED